MEQLQQDYETLGLTNSSPARFNFRIQPSEVENYTDLHNLMMGLSLSISYSRDNNCDFEMASKTDELTTDLGRRLLYLCSTQNRVRQVDHSICSDCEPRLVSSTKPKKIEMVSGTSPVVVTKNDEPIGVIKRYGSRVYYPLHDDTDTSTYAGFVYDTNVGNYSHPFQKMSNSTRAGNIPIEEVSNLFGGGRLTSLVLPVEAKQNLHLGFMQKQNREALTSTHKTVVNNVNRAFKNSVRVWLGSFHPDGADR